MTLNKITIIKEKKNKNFKEYRKLQWLHLHKAKTAWPPEKETSTTTPEKDPFIKNFIAPEKEINTNVVTPRKRL